MQDGHRLQDNSPSNNDRPCALVDDNLCPRKDRHFYRLNPSQQGRNLLAAGDRQIDSSTIHNMCSLTPQCLIDCEGHSFRTAEIGIIEQQRELVLALQLQWNSTFYHCSERDSGCVGMVELFHVPVSSNRITAYDKRALCLRIDLTVCSIKRSHQQQAALKTPRITRRRDSDIQLSAGSRKGRQCCGHKNCGQILYSNRRCRNAHSHPQKRGRKSLNWKSRLLTVAGALQTHNNAISNQLIVPNTLDRGDVLDTCLSWRRSCRIYRKSARSNSQQHCKSTCAGKVRAADAPA